MGLGVLEATKLSHVPGTVLLNDKAAHAEDIAVGLKHGKGRNSHIVLSPQPAEDPNDPLNWPAWKKELIIAILCLGSMLNAGTNGNGPEPPREWIHQISQYAAVLTLY